MLHAITVQIRPTLTYQDIPGNVNQINHMGDLWFQEKIKDATYKDMSSIIQVDDGSQITTTDNRQFLHGYRDLPKDKQTHLYCASKIKHTSVGFGYLLIPTTRFGTAAFFRSSFTPTLPTTVVSPNLHICYNKDKYTHKVIKDNLRKVH